MKKSMITISVLMGLVLFFGFNSFADNEMQVRKHWQDLKQKYAVATFAGGCFWCTESDFEKVDGVIDAISGYTGGHDMHPSYQSVSSGTTGHAESVQVFYDPEKVTYEKLLDVFWTHVNPTDAGGQFVDRGSQYRPEIFYHNETQKKLAEASKVKLEKAMIFDKPIAAKITRFEKFYLAEAYHQDYYKRNALRYKYYRWGSGRDQFLGKYWEDGKMLEKISMTDSDGMKHSDGMKNEESMMDSTDSKMENKMDDTQNMDNMNGMNDMKMNKWMKPDDQKIKKMLTPLQYQVTQENGTEKPFANMYWDNKKAGIYVDIVSGEPLFSSTDKFKSGTGWPSFTKPLEPGNVVEKSDKSFFMVRTEVRSKHGDSHLGHVFDDGPKPTGLRYCINSAALRFVPKEDLEKEGYGEYKKLF